MHSGEEGIFAIATDVGQKESGSCPAVVVKEVEVGGEGTWDSAGNGIVRWHV